MAYTDIDKPTDYFNTKLYTGTGSGNQSVTGVGFQPDWVWTKTRSIGYGHNLYDSVRGTGKYLQSNSTSAESSSATSMVSFDSDGFTVGTGDNVQYATNTGVSWNWLASNTTASNTDGSITSTVSANTTSGFSIVSYTGTGANATVGHGLGAAPAMIIQKNRIDAQPWWVYHSAIGAGGQLRLNETNAEGSDGGTLWNSTAPTSTVFSLGDNGGSNGSSDACIAYCFAEKKGYSKFGSYTGNGSTDGTFVYTGFKPAFVMVKITSATSNWDISTGAVSANQIDERLRANLSNAEESSGYIDFLSNGFKMRNTNTSQNLSGATYIYMAFAENPFVSSTGTPVTAR